MDATQRKEVGIIIAATLYSLLFFLALAFTYQGVSQIATVPVLVALIGFSWVALMAIFMAFVIHHQALQWALLLLPSLMAIVSSNFSGAALLGGVLLFLALLAAQRSIRAQVNNHLQLKIIGIFRSGVRILLLGTAAMAILLALPVIKNQAQSGQIKVTADAAATAIQPLAPIISHYIPNYQLSMTIDQIITSQIKQQPLPAGVQLPPAQIQRSRQALSDQINLTLTGNETIPDILSLRMNKYIQNLATSNGLLVTLVLVLLALVTIRALIPILVWPILALIAAIIWVAHQTHFIKKIQTPVTVERYQL